MTNGKKFKLGRIKITTWRPKENFYNLVSNKRRTKALTSVQPRESLKRKFSEKVQRELKVLMFTKHVMTCCQHHDIPIQQA